MAFGRKKKTAVVSSGIGAMRGREKADRNHKNSPESGKNPLARRFQLDDEPDTTDLVQLAGFPEPSDRESGEATTRVLSGLDADGDSKAKESLEDPVSGFLVVIEGPGRGNVGELGYGMNPIGRDLSQRISLDYGDLHISRESHCVVTFDPASGKFWIQPGAGRSLVYLDDQPVLEPTGLSAGDHIRLGGTVLRFVPLCGPGFSWENSSES